MPLPLIAVADAVTLEEYVYLLVSLKAFPLAKIPTMEFPAPDPVPIVIVKEVPDVTVFPEYKYLSVLLGVLLRRKYAVVKVPG
jgi:hypothetical protein